MEALSTSQFRSQPAEQDWASLATWLRSQGRTFGPTAPRQFAGGAANLNFLIEVDGQPTVLRRPPPGPLAEGASDMRREWRVLSTLPAHYPLAPDGLLFCEDATVLGAEFQLLEYRPGLTIGGSLPPELAARPEAPTALVAALVGAMATLHQLDPAAVGLGELGRPAGFYRRQVEGWSRRAEVAYSGAPPRAATTIIEHLRASIPSDAARPSLLHGDLKLDNMLIDAVNLAPVGVVDWDMATQGEPLFDLAVLLSYWVDGADPVGLREIGQLPCLEPGFPNRRDVAEKYFAAVGSAPTDLAFPLTLARLRLAIAWQQLHRLYLAGALSDRRYEEFVHVADVILQWTADTLTDPPL